MKFSYNWFQSFFNKKLPKPKKLAELLTIYSFEVKEIKKSGRDFVFDIDILSNRSDCFSHLGIAREIAAILDYKIKVPETKLREENKVKTKDFIDIKIKDKIACPRYGGRIILGIKVGSSPKWLKERLKLLGLKSINNIVDIANFVMLEIGQPLHAFDLDKIEGKKILVRFAKKGEKISTLDNQKFILYENTLVIADEKDPLVIAGIKGGKKAEIDSKTKNIFIESANFDRLVIRRTAKKINLKTDASLRFEHDLDPNLVDFSLDRVAKLIQKIGGGKITQGIIDFYPQRSLAKIIKLDLNYLKGLLGIEIPLTKVKSILKSLNFKFRETNFSSIEIEVPTFRLDISIPEDLIEEIGRIYGYNKIHSVFPTTILVSPKRNLEIFWQDMVRNILKEVGFSEVYNFSFISRKEAEMLNYKKDDLVEVENPPSLDLRYLRPSLIPLLLKDVQRNQDNFREIQIFELGEIFKRKKSNLIEKKMISGLITGDSFFKIKGISDSLLNKIGISEVFYDEYQATPEETKISIWNPKKIAEVKINGQEIGFLGEVSKQILEKFGILQEVTFFDIDFEKLQKYASEEHEYQPISRYPAAIRDIAVLVPNKTKIDYVLEKIESISSLIRDVDIFDIYEGEEIPEGKKNLAFHIIYQAEDRTLSPTEIEKIQKKIIKVLEAESNWEVRK